MYHAHFGLRESPFSIAPDPRYLLMSARHREALAHLLFGIASDGGFVLLTGEVGTGKTTVCRCLLEQLPPQTQVACLLNPRLSVPELLAALCDELHISYPEGNASIKVFVDRINAFLLDAHAAGRRIVLIIDEAQNLSTEVLEQIRLLTNLETSRRKLLQIILLGQPELRDKLDRQEMRQLRQRITACYHLEPLNRAETVEYVRHRLTVAGLSRPLFTGRALASLYRLSGGIPRQINLICDRALLGAYAQGKGEVGRQTLVRAAAEMNTRGAARFPLRGAAMIVLLVGAAAFGAGYRFMAPKESIPADTAEAVPATVSFTATPAAAPPAPVPPAVTEIAWPTNPSPHSKEAAYRTLLAAWGLGYAPERHGDACDFAERNRLSCLYRRGSLGSLRLLDRPAVLSLRTGKGETFYATLVTLPAEGEEAVTLTVDGEEFRAPLRDLERHWFGEFTVIWRKPPFDNVLRPGDRGPEVDWLALRLAAALGGPEPARGLALEGKLLQRLKTFQEAHGLEPDGCVGPNTLIHLDSVLGGGSPRLTALAGGE
jgi:general secretion pathway protein A